MLASPTKSSVPSGEVARAGVSDRGSRPVTAAFERLKSKPKEPTKKRAVPSSDLTRAGVSHPAVAIAEVRKSKVDWVDSVDSRLARRGYPGLDLKHFRGRLPHRVSPTDFLARPNFIFFNVRRGRSKLWDPSLRDR
jgi:hypothetical protein